MQKPAQQVTIQIEQPNSLLLLQLEKTYTGAMVQLISMLQKPLQLGIAKYLVLVLVILILISLLVEQDIILKVLNNLYILK